MKILIRAGYDGINTDNVLDIFLSYGVPVFDSLAAARMQESWQRSYKQLCNLIGQETQYALTNKFIVIVHVRGDKL